MTDEELLAACKDGLNISQSSTAFDNVLKQKLLATKGFLINAGVSDTQLATDLGVATVVLGVSDLWNVKNGEVQFSPVFRLFVVQLASSSLEAAP